MKHYKNFLLCTTILIFLAGCTQLDGRDKMTLEQTKVIAQEARDQAVQAARDAASASESAERSARDAAVAAGAANSASEKANRIFEHSIIK